MARTRVGRAWSDNVRQTSNVADKRLNILLWGRPGTGKTLFMGTAPKPFIIASEDGVLTLHDKEIPYYVLSPEEKVFDTVMQIIDDARKSIGVFEDINTICVDSVWKLNRMILEEIMEESGVTKAQHDQWGELLSRMSKIFSTLLSMDYHVIASVGEQVREDKMTEELKPVFNMSGSYKDQIAYEFDFNIFLEKKAKGSRVEFLAHALDHDKRNAKSRVALPPTMHDLNFDLVWDTVQSELGTLKK